MPSDPDNRANLNARSMDQPDWLIAHPATREAAGDATGYARYKAGAVRKRSEMMSHILRLRAAAQAQAR